MNKIYVFLSFFCLAFTNYAQVSISANIPQTLNANTVYTVEIKINKGNINSFSKYQLDVPTNIVMSEGNSKEGNFSFINGRAKIVWVQIPSDNEVAFTMVMRVGNASGQGTFNHKFYYIDSDNKKEAEGEAMEVTFTNIPNTNNTNNNNTSVNATVNASEPTHQPVISNTVKTQEQNTQKQTTETAKTTATVAENKPVASNTVNTVSENKANTSTATNSNELKQYRIQIGAFATNPGTAKFKNLGEVNIENADGKYKVLIGNFSSKEEAVKKQNDLKNAGYNGYIVTFINGVRAK